MPHFLAFQQSKQLKWKRKNNYWCFRKYVGFFFLVFFPWVNIKSHSKLWSECFWAFQTSRKLATFHSTCQLPQSVWTGNLLLRLSYLLLSYCQGCLGNENHCEVSLLLFFLLLFFLCLPLPGTTRWMQINPNMRRWRRLLCGFEISGEGLKSICVHTSGHYEEKGDVTATFARSAWCLHGWTVILAVCRCPRGTRLHQKGSEW